MEHLPEFISNHLFLVGGLVVVLIMTIKAELDHQVCKSFQVSPVNAIRMMNDEDALLLDVRESAEFKKEHIKNAVNIPVSALKDKLEDIKQYKDKSVLAYCRSGVTSAHACKTLKRSGFMKVHNIEGGLHGWQEAKLPLSK